MKIKVFLFLASLLVAAPIAAAADVNLEANRIVAIGVTATITNLAGKKAVMVVKDPRVKEFDEPTFARIKNLQFTNGLIKVKVFSRLRTNAPPFARGFIGIAFRIDDANTKFESIYLRPANARAEDQLRRNHSIQYFSFPDFKFDRLRKESPGHYESYADMELEKWITMRIEVNGTKAKLFLNQNEQPSLVVNDLKHGIASGGIGFWVDEGTEGFFADLQVQRR